MIDFYRPSFIWKSVADMEEGHKNCGFKCAVDSKYKSVWTVTLVPNGLFYFFDLILTENTDDRLTRLLTVCGGESDAISNSCRENQDQLRKQAFDVYCLFHIVLDKQS